MRESRIPLWESGFHAFFSLATAKRGYKGREYFRQKGSDWKLYQR